VIARLRRDWPAITPAIHVEHAHFSFDRCLSRPVSGRCCEGLAPAPGRGLSSGGREGYSCRSEGEPRGLRGSGRGPRSEADRRELAITLHVDGGSGGDGGGRSRGAPGRAEGGDVGGAGERARVGGVDPSYPDDKGIGRAFGVGAGIDAKKTGALMQLAGQLTEAFASKEWNARATAAGVTQARIDAVTAQRSSLSGADVSQQGLFATNVDGTVQKDALLKAVSGSTTYARKVAGVVLKGNATALASFVPARARAAKKGAKRAVSAVASAASAAKPKATRKAPAKGKLRARRAQVKARAKTLAAGPTLVVAATKAKRNPAKKAASKKRAK